MFSGVKIIQSKFLFFFFFLFGVLQQQQTQMALSVLLYYLFTCTPFRYNKLCGSIKKLQNKLSKLDPRDPFRKEMTERLLEKLYHDFFLVH
jgi:hypothetical protein